GQGPELTRTVVPLLMESVRGYLLANSRGRGQERMPWYHPLRLWPITDDGQLAPPIDCQGKDISLDGIGFHLPGELTGPDVCLYLPPTDRNREMLVRARVVRAVACADGWHQLGAVLGEPWEGPIPDGDPRGGG